MGITINPDALTIADMGLIMSAGAATNTADIMPKLIDMLNRVVVGGVDHYPASKLSEIFAEVIRQWGEAANPKASAA